MALAHASLKSKPPSLPWPHRLPLEPCRVVVMVMTQVSATEIAQLVDALSTDERLALIDHLLAGLPDAGLPVTAAQQAELSRRLGSFDTQLADAQPWQVVRAELALDLP